LTSPSREREITGFPFKYYGQSRKKSKSSLFRHSGESRARSEAFCAIQCFQKVMTDLDPGFRRGDDFLRDHLIQ